MAKRILFLLSFTFIFCLLGCTPTNRTTTTELSSEDDAIVVFLFDKFNECIFIDERLQKSEGTGADVKFYYESMQDLILEIKNKEVPIFLQPIKDELLEGVKKYSDGVGCFSNKSICKSDAEAVRLRFEGKLMLDKFKDDLGVYDYR